MSSHLFLLFFNAILLSVITSVIVLVILKKEYSQFFKNEGSGGSVRSVAAEEVR